MSLVEIKPGYFVYRNPDPNKELASYKEYAEGEIKKEASQRISALDWKITRATEQGADLATVYAERQAIRDASSQAETDMKALTTIEEVKTFTW